MSCTNHYLGTEAYNLHFKLLCLSFVLFKGYDSLLCTKISLRPYIAIKQVAYGGHDPQPVEL